MIDWSKIKYFTPNENWGDADRIDPLLVSGLDLLRDKVGHPFHINCAYAEDGHKDDSWHYKGKAADFIIKDLPFKDAIDKLLEALDELDMSDVVGLGIYPDWNTPGFHLDTRGFKARWGQWQGQYISFNQALSHV